MDVITFTIRPTEPPWSTNDERNFNRYVRHQRVKAWKGDTQAAWLTVKQAALNTYPRISTSGTDTYFVPSIVQLHIGFKERRRRDPHNYCGTVLKAVVDGLVKAGLWPDDTPDWVGHREPLLVTGLNTEVEIWPQ